MILELNRLGMLIDLSHTSHDTMRDAVALSQAPVINSHANPWAMCNHVRNVPDDILDSIVSQHHSNYVGLHKEYEKSRHKTQANRHGT